MKPAICTQCGGLIEVDETKEAGICASCGTAFITEKVISNYITNHNTINNITNINYGEKKDGDYEFKQALTRLKLGDFDEAAVAIEKATEKAPENPKYWIYDAYIDTEKFTRIPAEWCYRGGYDSSKPIEKSIESVANFFALAQDEDKRKYSSELGISDIQSEGCCYITFKAKGNAARDLIAAMQDIIAREGVDPYNLVFDGECPVFDKFDDYIPPELLRAAYAEDRLCVEEFKERFE